MEKEKVKNEICRNVHNMCRENGIDYLLILEDGKTAWHVDRDEYIKKIAYSIMMTSTEISRERI